MLYDVVKAMRKPSKSLGRNAGGVKHDVRRLGDTTMPVGSSASAGSKKESKHHSVFDEIELHEEKAQ